MITLPHDAKQFNIKGAAVDYFQFHENNQDYIYFDATQQQAPEPMMDAIRGLTQVDHKDTKLVMINRYEPSALVNKLGDSYDVQTIDLEDGNCQIIFTYKGGHYKKITLNDFDHRSDYTKRKL